MTEEDLVRLMVAYQAGEWSAFERLYAVLAPELRRYFAAAAPQRGASADLAQETFLELHRSRHTYQPPLPVRPWVFGVARNVLRRHRRLAWRRARYEEGAADLDTASTALERKGAATNVEPQDVEAALRRLPPGRREVWLLHHVHGFSFQQIGERLRIGAGAAKLRSSRAMKALRAALGLGDGGRDG